MHLITNLLASVSLQSRVAMASLGWIAFVGGVLLMIRHKRQVDEIQKKERDANIRRFEQRKFQRRSLASTLVASLGVMMISLYWARDPYVFATLLSLVLILLFAVMSLACLDLLMIGLQSFNVDDKTARQKMIKEYLRQRDKRNNNSVESDER